MVIQETILFEDTIANNIAYGSRADRERRHRGSETFVTHTSSS